MRSGWALAASLTSLWEFVLEGGVAGRLLGEAVYSQFPCGACAWVQLWFFALWSLASCFSSLLREELALGGMCPVVDGTDLCHGAFTGVCCHSNHHSRREESYWLARFCARNVPIVATLKLPA